MRSSMLRTSGLAAAAGCALVAVAVPLALAAPTAAPPSDSQGYVDSTARCTQPDTAVIFGATDSSRVAICKTAAGEYQYRGVRVRDGAKLITTATVTSEGNFVVRNDGATYTLTPQALGVTVNGNTYRTEAWTDYHGPQSPATTSGKPSTSGTAAPTTSATSASASPTTPASASTPKTTSAPATSATPLPPPLPAEVGGTSSGGHSH